MCTPSDFIVIALLAGRRPLSAPSGAHCATEPRRHREVMVDNFQGPAGGRGCPREQGGKP